MTRALIVPLALSVVAILAGCSTPPLKVGGIQLGSSLNADNTVGRFTTTFKPTDTIYLSVLTTDMGSGTITAKWSYNGRPAGERSKAVSFRIAGATEFHMQSSEGFPPGPYSVEVLLDGKPVGTRTFTVSNTP
jgi:hypothetical protein